MYLLSFLISNRRRGLLPQESSIDWRVIFSSLCLCHQWGIPRPAPDNFHFVCSRRSLWGAWTYSSYSVDLVGDIRLCKNERDLHRTSMLQLGQNLWLKRRVLNRISSCQLKLAFWYTSISTNQNGDRSRGFLESAWIYQSEKFLHHLCQNWVCIWMWILGVVPCMLPD